VRHSLLLSLLSVAAVAATTLTLSGCGRNEAAEAHAAPPAPQVTVAAAISRKITESDEFTGRFEAVERVELRPRVSGYIASVNFKEGSEVKKGDVLFVIDPRPYQAERDKAAAGLAQARSQLVLARTERERGTKLLAQHAISQEEYDTRTAGSEQAEANVEAAKAALDAAALNLEFTRVTAPISGRISRALVTSGNFVTSGQTPLTTLVSLDPIYLDIDMSESDYLAFARERARVSGPLANQIVFSLGDENRFIRTGTLDFVDNNLNRSSGTIHVRATVPNGDLFLVPGEFARIRIAVAPPAPTLLVPDAAVALDQSQHMVMTVSADGTVVPKPVETGDLRGGLRVIQAGLDKDDRVIIDGVVHAIPGTKVEAQDGTIQYDETADTHR
jgi:membrane fusion protein, multidrug efflux system